MGGDVRHGGNQRQVLAALSNMHVELANATECPQLAEADMRSVRQDAAYDGDDKHLVEIRALIIGVFAVLYIGLLRDKPPPLAASIIK
jgi:hypothetical protein